MRKKKTMRLPNGYGTIKKLSGNRRKPYWVGVNPRLAISEDKKRSHYEYDHLGSYESWSEALEALTDYNRDPYDVKASSITFAEVYQKWSERKFSEISESNIKGYRASYKICSELYDMKFSDIKLDHMQRVIDASGKNTPTLKKLKVLFSQMFEYAVIHDIITKERDVTAYLDITKAGNPNAIDRQPFTKKEIKVLWQKVESNEYVQVFLMLIYTGVRIGELLDLKKENVNLDEQWFDVVASKTDAGIRRVPIADLVLPFFVHWMNRNDSEYLLSTPDGKHFLYRNYVDSYWTPFAESLGMGKHRPHDTRHTCISLLTTAGVDERIIKKIVGHKGQGVTQAVYTQIEIDELLKNINKIPCY